MSEINERDSRAEMAIQITEKSEPQHTGNGSIFVRIFDAIRESWTNNGRIKFILTALGIFLSFICVGILQERIMRGCYGDEGNKDCPPERRFKYAITLVAVQMLSAFILIKSK